MGKIQAFFLVLAVITSVRAAETGFWEQLTPAERRAAGLDRLTPEQQAALNRLAERYLHPAAAPVSEAARQAIREEAKQEVRAEVKAELQAAETKKAVARAGLPEAGSATVIRTRITGDFQGWTGQTVFYLENGQTWKQTNSDDSIWIPTRKSPEVEIRSAGLFGWKLYVVGTGLSVHVRRVR